MLIPLLNKTTAKKKGGTRTRRFPTAPPKNKSKKSDVAPKVRPALPVLTLTDERATLATLESVLRGGSNFMRMVEGC